MWQNPVLKRQINQWSEHLSLEKLHMHKFNLSHVIEWPVSFPLYKQKDLLLMIGFNLYMDAGLWGEERK